MDALTFPEPRDDRRLVVSTPAQPALSLRSATTDDLPYLRSLYAASRAAELACMPWSSAMKSTFCDSQFDLQHRHYVANFQPADFNVVVMGGVPSGRLYVYRPEPQRLHVIDILLEERVRGQGIGTALLHALQDSVNEDGLMALSLHVDMHNAKARALYEKLGFIVAGLMNGTHLRMTWSP